MGCASCATGPNGKPEGCGNKGLCLTGSCNKLNTYDWISTMEIRDVEDFDISEISFKNGARKSFYRKPDYLDVITGDYVAVESRNGYDVGQVALSGELVRLQLKKKKTAEDQVSQRILRRANTRDLEKLSEARSKEKETLVRSRSIARTMGLEMKVGDVEFQADLRKATFYYTAEGRVDFRELVRVYAKEFNVKIEMRQIGARQESSRIGGMGSCGRELCCSTWLTDFKSVSTAAARYQNLAIRLKCCLNYELDTYMNTLNEFPMKAEKLHSAKGKASLIKTDIFKKLMYYAYDNEMHRSQLIPLPVEKVREIFEMNKAGEKPDDLIGITITSAQDDTMDFADVTGQIELKEDKKRRKKRRKRPQGKRNSRNNQNKSQ